MQTTHKVADKLATKSSVPSKTQLKRQSQDLQDLGQSLLGLSATQLASLHLPQRLQEALQQARQMRSFEGRRRQMQFVGKLMRDVDAEPIRQALQQQQSGTQASLELHALEHWREHLLAQDQGLYALLQVFPKADAQHLRALLRQARKDQDNTQPESVPTHPASRQSKAYRTLFQELKILLHNADAATAKAFLHDTQ